MRLILSLLFLGFNISMFAQNFNAQQVDAYLEYLNKENRFMGSVALLQNNKVIYTKAVGYQNLSLQKNATPKSTYHIGSISKTFTATLILKAIEEGKLTLQTPLSQYYAQIPNAEKITIGHLLNHSSGIFNFTDAADYQKIYYKAQSKTTLLDFIQKLGTSFEPGTQHGYSNANYLLLSYILEDIYAQSYAMILEQKITNPLKLKSTYLGNKKDKQKTNSYLFMNKWIISPKTHYSVPLGAGAIVSTPKDLVLFGTALLQGKILKPETLALMLDFKEAYGLGIFQLSPEAVGHTGGIDGYQSILVIYEKGDKALAIISNGMNYNIESIVLALESALEGNTIALPDFSKVELSKEALQAYVGVYHSEEFPLDITITEVDGILYGQATGQGAFPLEATSKTVFVFNAAGIKLTFDLQAKTMLLQQAGQEFLFEKA